MRQHFRAAISQLLIWTLIAGIIYPGFVTGAAQLLFSHRANGSVIRDRDDQIIGSELIGQSFSSANYFWGRPSATAPHPYNAAASSGSNLGPTNTALADAVKQRIALLQAADPENRAPVPVDLVTASGSGLDPAYQPGRSRISSCSRRQIPQYGYKRRAAINCATYRR